MRVKLPLENLNPSPYPPPHFTSTYTYGVTITLRVCDGKFSFLNIHVLQLALRVLHRPNPATKNSNPYQKITNKNKKKKLNYILLGYFFFFLHLILFEYHLFIPLMSYWAFPNIFCSIIPLITNISYLII